MSHASGTLVMIVYIPSQNRATIKVLRPFDRVACYMITHGGIPHVIRPLDEGRGAEPSINRILVSIIGVLLGDIYRDDRWSRSMDKSYMQNRNESECWRNARTVGRAVL